MPELPEVEVVRLGLERFLPGRTVVDYRSNEKPLRLCSKKQDMRRWLIGSRFLTVGRRAKYLLLELDNRSLLVIHLGMTGRLGLFPAKTPALTHDHRRWLLDNGLELRFNDARRFGSLLIFPEETRDTAERELFAGVGLEPFAPDCTADYMRAKAAGRTLPVKQFLMDGRTVAGIGNIYANEALFAARIRPDRPAGRISRKKWLLLLHEITRILRHAIACGGSSINDFLGTDGKGGYFQVHFSVYGRVGQACPRCFKPIKAIRLAGRSTFFCASCQR